MNVVTLIQPKIQAVIVLLLSIACGGILMVYRQQLETQAILRQAIIQDEKLLSMNQAVNELIPLLKSIQANQAEQTAMLAKLAAYKADSNKVPATKMKNLNMAQSNPPRRLGIRLVHAL